MPRAGAARRHSRRSGAPTLEPERRTDTETRVGPTAHSTTQPAANSPELDWQATCVQLAGQTRTVMHTASAGTEAVRDFWNRASCGEEAYPDPNIRYTLEPYLAPFARFADGRDRDVLEIGVGMGADHLRWAQSRPSRLAGVDLTPRAVAHTRARLEALGFTPDVREANAESLPFPDASFDLVYSWGVLHHSPDTARAIREVGRVLRPAGTARVMIYHTYSPVGAMLWLRYALLRGRPFQPLAQVYAQHLESPGTKAFTRAEAEAMFREAGFRAVATRVTLSFGDLLEGAAGQRHRGPLLTLARSLWPRRLLRRFGDGRLGLILLIEASK